MDEDQSRPFSSGLPASIGPSRIAPPPYTQAPTQGLSAQVKDMSSDIEAAKRKFELNLAYIKAEDSYHNAKDAHNEAEEAYYQAKGAYLKAFRDAEKPDDSNKLENRPYTGVLNMLGLWILFVLVLGGLICETVATRLETFSDVALWIILFWGLFWVVFQMIHLRAIRAKEKREELKETLKGAEKMV